jgi:hypothetical protein
METKHWLSATVSCLALTLWAVPAAAAPIAIGTSTTVAPDGNSTIEMTHWRRRDYYYSEHSPDDFDRYYPYDELSYGCPCDYPSYHYYYVYSPYRYYRHHHRHHRHHHRYREYRRW